MLYHQHTRNKTIYLQPLLALAPQVLYTIYLTTMLHGVLIFRQHGVNRFIESAFSIVSTR